MYTRWQWSVNLYKNRKQTARKEKQYTKQYKNNTKNIEYTKYKTKIQNKNKKYIRCEKSHCSGSLKSRKQFPSSLDDVIIQF